MAAKKLYRSEKDRVIGGVCGGLADYLEMDSTVVRLVFLLLFFGAGVGLLPYIIMWIIIPTESNVKKEKDIVDAEVVEKK
jgi:phage shock protein C